MACVCACVAACSAARMYSTDGDLSARVVALVQGFDGLDGSDVQVCCLPAGTGAGAGASAGDRVPTVHVPPGRADAFGKLLLFALTLRVDSLMQVTATSNFNTDLGLDSLDGVELVMALEDEFGQCAAIIHHATSHAWFTLASCSTGPVPYGHHTKVD